MNQRELNRRGFLAYHFDLEESFVTVVEEVFCLSAVDSDDTQKKLTAEPQSHQFDFLTHDSIWKGMSHW